MKSNRLLQNKENDEHFICLPGAESPAEQNMFPLFSCFAHMKTFFLHECQLSTDILCGYREKKKVHSCNMRTHTDRLCSSAASDE